MGLPAPVNVNSHSKSVETELIQDVVWLEDEYVSTEVGMCIHHESHTARLPECAHVFVCLCMRSFTCATSTSSLSLVALQMLRAAGGAAINSPQGTAALKTFRHGRTACAEEGAARYN